MSHSDRIADMYPNHNFNFKVIERQIHELINHAAFKARLGALNVRALPIVAWSSAS